MNNDSDWNLLIVKLSLSNLSTFWGIAEITSENKGDACAIIKEET